MVSCWRESDPMFGANLSPISQKQDRDRGPVARDPSHTTVHAGPHTAVRFLEADLLQISSRLASPCLWR